MSEEEIEEERETERWEGSVKKQEKEESQINKSVKVLKEMEKSQNCSR